jgi:hypothetical protein
MTRFKLLRTAVLLTLAVIYAIISAENNFELTSYLLMILLSLMTAFGVFRFKDWVAIINILFLEPVALFFILYFAGAKLSYIGVTFIACLIEIVAPLTALFYMSLRWFPHEKQEQHEQHEQHERPPVSPPS